MIVPIIVFNVIGDAHELGFGLSSNTLIKLFAVFIIFLVEGLNSNDEFIASFPGYTTNIEEFKSFLKDVLSKYDKQ